jgi:tetratricopeptide (TPR) repeat protein
LRNPSSARRHDAQPAIPALAQEYATFDSALQLLLARPADEVLPALEAALDADPGAWHPDLLWLAARRAQRPMPGATALFEDALRRLEPPRSLRVTTSGPPPAQPALESDAQAFFSRIEKTILEGDLESADEWLRVGKVRHPGDRRLWQWQGWVDIARGRLDEAEQAFRRADRLGGMTPYLHLEQTLGLAVVAELRDPASRDLELFLDYEDQAGRLLSMRLPIAARPDLEALLPPGARDD